MRKKVSLLLATLLVASTVSMFSACDVSGFIENLKPSKPNENIEQPNDDDPVEPEEDDTYTVTITVNNAAYGSVDVESVTEVAEGTAISVEGNVLTIGETVITATEKDPDTAWVYSFTGFYYGGDTVTQDMTITANFSATLQVYKMTFEMGDGEPISAKKFDYWTTLGTVLSDVTVVAPEGYRFDKWQKKISDGVYEDIDDAEILKGNITLKAIYAINTYTVTWLDADGNELEKDTVDAGGKLSFNSTLPATGYTFAGWVDENGEFVDIDNYMVTSNVVLTAKYWTKDYFEVMGFSAEELGEDSMTFTGTAMNFTLSQGGGVEITKTSEGAFVTAIDGASAEDNAKVDGSMLKLATYNGHDWGSSMKTTFNGAIDAAFEKGFEYVEISLYVAYTGDYIPLHFSVGAYNASVLDSTTTGWKTVRISKSVWGETNVFFVALHNIGSTRYDFDVYFDSIKGGYNEVKLPDSQQGFENTDGISFGHSSGLTYNESYEIVNTISGASAEDLAQIQGSMLKLSFANGMAASTSTQKGIWSNFGKDYIDAFRTDSNTEYIVLKFYVQFNGELPEEDTVKAYIAYGIHATNPVWAENGYAINLNASGWYTLSIHVGQWNSNTGNANTGWFFYSENNVDVTFYFDEMYAIDKDNAMVTLASDVSINFVEKTGLTAEQLAGTYVMNGQEKVELTAEQLVAYTPVAGQDIVIVVNVDGYKQSEFVLKVS